MDFIRSSPTCTGTRDAEQPSGSFCARINKCIQKVFGICAAHASATINLEFTSPTTVTVSGSYAANYPGGNKADNIAPTTETFSFQPDSNQAVVNLPAGASAYSPSISIECAAPRSLRGNPGLGVTVLCLDRRQVLPGSKQHPGVGDGAQRTNRGDGLYRRRRDTRGVLDRSCVRGGQDLEEATAARYPHVRLLAHEECRERERERCLVECMCAWTTMERA